MQREIVLDTETTGLDPAQGHRVVELGAVELVNHLPTGRTFHAYLNPERDMPEEAFRIHGLSAEFLADHPVFAEVVDAFLEFLGDGKLVIHNAAFDIGFLDAELRRIGRAPFLDHGVRVTDSLSMARDSFPGKSNSLDALCKRFEVNSAMRELHGALLDAGLLAEVYIRMTRGQDSLVIDAGDAFAADLALRPVDFGALALIVIAADDDDLAGHAALLAEIDKASGGQAVWRAATAAPPPLAMAQ